MRLAFLLAFMILSGAIAQEPIKPKDNKPTDPPKKNQDAPKKKDDPNNQPKKKDGPQRKPATPVEDLTTLPGFKIELLHTAEPATEGSWIAMCADDKGRLIISGQPNQPHLRVTLKDGKVAQVEKLKLPISGSMGLLYANNSLYVNGIGEKGFGLYRCFDTKGTDQFDKIEFLKAFAGNGEHGPHGIAQGPDGKLYIINGNHTRIPDGLSKSSPHRTWAEDHLLPRQWDGNGHAAGILAPGGYVVRTDAEGKEWELVLGGFRNAYDLAFNGDGELFTFDSDMEWDWGMPWYRPTRVNHCVSAAEFGWRSGTGKWPDYYPDSLPAVVDIGIGSPTGVLSGAGAKFPAKYQRAIYIMDWSYGRLMAVHLTPKGSTYSATFENLVAPKGLDGTSRKLPLNLTDMTIGADGALYFTVGGRNTQAALYRVSYVGPESTAPADLKNEAGAKERALRRSLEAFHGKQDKKAVAAGLAHLGNPDRFIRYAARLALESQPLADWHEQVLLLKEPQAVLNGLLGMVRQGDAKQQPQVLAKLAELPLRRLSDELQLDKLRVLQLSLARHGAPPTAVAKAILSEVDSIFPSANEFVNREAVQVLVFLRSPSVLSKALKLAASAQTQEDMMYYLFHLRTMPVGFWTLEQRKEYLSFYLQDRTKLRHPPELLKWFAEAGRSYNDGASMNNFLKNFLREAVANMAEVERTALHEMIAAIDKAATVSYDVKPRPIVKQWQFSELVGKLDKVEKGRNFERGREAYIVSQCIKCHRFGNEGGAVGPELTAISSRFDRKAILESILEPSKVVSEQYMNITVATAGGKVITGKLIDENEATIAIQVDPLSPERVTIKKADIESREYSKVSPMPMDLINVLTEEEILDMIAYMESGGRKQYRAFQK